MNLSSLQYIECFNEKCLIKPCTKYYGFNETSEMIEAWNTRAINEQT